MIKIGVVVQRYGKDVIGGAEALAREVAERLTLSGFDITVFTTTARDYITWRNHYQTGESILKGVMVKRFLVKNERDIETFNKYSEKFFADTESQDEMKWILTQGPYCPDLVESLKKEQKFYDLFLFFTYLYYPTVAGLEVIDKPVILFPTAHDEPPIYMKIMRNVFSRPESLFFLTGAEMSLVKKIFVSKAKMKLVRTGIDIRDDVDEDLFRKKHLIFAPYMIYAGRIEKGKGLEGVFNAYLRIHRQRLINFILIGKKLMNIPSIEGLNYLGYVSEEEKFSAFKGAVFSVQPSPLESLSISTLESYSQKTPVLVNEKSSALMEHISISGGGYSYRDELDFMDKFFLLYDSRKLRKSLGQKGYEYVRNHYSWTMVMQNIKKGIMELISN